MASPADCLRDVLAAADKNIKRLPISELNKLAKEAETRLDGVTVTAQKKQILDELFEETKVRKAEAKKAEKVMQLFKNNQLAADALESLKFKTAGKANSPSEVARGVLFGESNQQVKGGDLTPKGIANGYKATMLEVANKEIYSDKDLRAAFESGAVEGDYYLELDAVQNGKPFVTKNTIAQRLAAAVNKAQEIGAKHMEGKVPYFERIEGYLMKMMYNTDRIVANREAFIKDMVEYAGEKTFPSLTAEQRVAAFSQIWQDMASGTYGRAISIGPKNPNIAVRLAQTRVITPNDTKAAIAIRTKYGLSAHDTFHKYVDTVSNDLGIIDKLGPSPMEAINHVLGTIQNAVGGKDSKVNFDVMKSEMEGYFSIVSGTANQAPTGFWAKVLHASMVWSRSTMLGFARLASFTDMAMAPSAITVMHGKSMSTTAAKVMMDYAGNTFKSKESQLKSAVAMGLTMDMLHSRLMDISYKNSTGWTKTGKWLGNTMNKLNLLENHVQAIRNTIADAACMHWGDRLGTAFDKLTPQESNALKRVGIGKAEWELLGKYVSEKPMGGSNIRIIDADIISKMSDDDVKAYITAKHAENVAIAQKNFDRDLESEKNFLADKVRTELTAQGATPKDIMIEINKAKKIAETNYRKRNAIKELTVTKTIIDEAKTDILNKFYAMIAKMADQGSSSPGVREMYALTGARSINSGHGALLRVLGMFKSAALVNVNNYKRSWNLGGKAILDEGGQAIGSKANISGVVQTATLATMCYMLSQYARDAAQGKEPRDPLDPAFITQSVAAAGVGGIVVSAMLDSFSESTGAYSSGQSIISSLAGPLVNKGALAAGIIGKTVQSGAEYAMGVSDGERTKMPTKVALNFLSSSVPLMNLFYTKGLIDYSFVNGMKEAAYPKYISELMKAEKNRDIKNFEGTKRREYFMLNPKESVRF